MSRRTQAGFSLIEIIVAFGVLALGLTLLLGTLSGASRQLHQAGDAGRAALLAQSLLEEDADALLRPGKAEGELEGGRYHWQREVVPWKDPQPRAGMPVEDPAAARLLHVRLALQWGEGGPQQRLQITSLRLAPAAPPGGDP